MQTKHLENNEENLQQEVDEIAKINGSDENQELAGSTQHQSSIKPIFIIIPVHECKINNIEPTANSNIDETQNQDADKVEANDIEINESIKPLSDKEWDFRGYSYEVNIKLSNSRDQLQNSEICESFVSLSIEMEDAKSSCSMLSYFQLMKQRMSRKKNSKTTTKPKKNKWMKVCTCCAIIIECPIC